MISCETVLSRVYNFARVCPNYKQGIASPKQGGMYFRIFCPKQGQGFKPSAAHLYPNMGRVPPPPTWGSDAGTLKIRLLKVATVLLKKAQTDEVSPHPPPPKKKDARCKFSLFFHFTEKMFKFCFI